MRIIDVIKKNIAFINIFKIRILAGFNYYAKYVSKYGARAKIIICPGGMGDVYVCCQNCGSVLLPGTNDDTPVLVVTRQASIEVAKMFGVRNIELLPYDKRRALLNMAMFEQFNVLQFEIISPMMLALYYQIYTNMEGVHGITEFDNFTYSNGTKWSGHLSPIFSGFDSSLYPFIAKNKTVLLIPYSVSMEEISEKFWVKLVEKLAMKGFTVITNSKGDDEPAIKGTKAVNIKLNEIVPFVEYCGICIGVRSGIMDVMESAKIKRVIYYPRVKSGMRALGKTSNNSWVSFSYNKWFGDELAMEMNYIDEFQDYIINNTLEYIK